MRGKEIIKKVLVSVLVFVVGATMLIAMAAVTTPKVTGTHIIIVYRKYTDTIIVPLGDAVTFRTIYYLVSNEGVTYRMFKKDYVRVNVDDQVQITSLSDRTNVLVKIFG